MNTDELYNLCKDLLDETFIGIFAKDKLPNLNFKRNFCLIMNLDTSNLPGTHWIAVVGRGTEAYIFDPLGLAMPLFLINWISRYYDEWSINTRQVQSSFSNDCGYMCLHFLYFANLLKDIPLHDIIDLLYPINKSINYYDYITYKFKNIFV